MPQRRTSNGLVAVAIIQFCHLGGGVWFPRYGRIQWAPCWAHVRRHFYDLEQAHASPVAQEALLRIGALFAIEEKIRGKPPDERRATRQAQSKPLLDSLRQWFETTLAKLSRKSETMAAIRYALSRWDALVRFVDDGRIEMDNNAAERSCAAWL